MAKKSEPNKPKEDAEVRRLRKSFLTPDAGTKMTIARLQAQHKLAGGVQLDRPGAGLKKPKAESRKGQRHYQVGGLIAKGAMGAVFVAQDNNTCRHVAMKLMLEDVKTQAGNVARFIEEAQVMGQLDHPNIVPVHDLSLDMGANPYYTMKLVRGVTLEEIIEDLVDGQAETLEQYPLSRLITIFQKVCDAVAFAHSRGVIHRDLKPENIMVGEYGEVQLMDWGLTKILQSDAPPPKKGTKRSKSMSAGMAGDWVREPVESLRAKGDTYKTLKGQQLGTPLYMSPEQVHGQMDEHDERSDIFSLGAILYHLLSLQPPHMAEDISAVLVKVIGEDPIAPGQLCGEDGKPLFVPHNPGGRIPSGLSAVAMKALAKDPAQRYQSVKEMQADIERWLGGFATRAEGAGALKLIGLLANRHKVETRVLLGCGLLLTVLISGFLIRLGQERRRAFDKKYEAEVALDKFSKARRKTIEARKETVRVLLGKAKYALARNNWEGTLKFARQTLEADGSNLEARILLGRVSLANHDFVGAAAAFDRVKELDPDDAGWETNSLRLLAWGCQRAAARHGGILTRDEMENLKFEFEENQNDLKLAARVEEVFVILADSTSGRMNALRGVIAKANPAIVHLRFQYKESAGGLLLDLKNNPDLTDIRALRGVKLTGLDLRGSKVADISVLKELPLTELSLVNTPVASLGPLRGMKLRRLGLSGTKVTDLSALQDLPLEELSLNGLDISDISVLRHMPLERLYLLNCRKLERLSALRGLKQLKELWLPPHISGIRLLRKFPKLRIIVTSAQNKRQTAAEFWEQYQAGVFRTRSALKEANPAYAFTGNFSIENGRIIGIDLAHAKLTDISALKKLPLTSLRLTNTGIKDLKPLRKMPLKELYLHFCAEIKSLGPLARLGTLERLTVPAHLSDRKFRRFLGQLKTLDYGWNEPDQPEPKTAVAYLHKALKAWNPDYAAKGLSITFAKDGKIVQAAFPRQAGLISLEPLRGMPLTHLWCAGGQLTDLEPLSEMPLKVLGCSGNRISSLEPLADMPLVSLTCYNNPLTSLSPFVKSPPDSFVFDCDSLAEQELKRAAHHWSGKKAHQHLARDAEVLLCLRRGDYAKARSYALSFKKHQYLAAPRCLKRKAAAELAGLLGGHLATIGSAEEHDFLSSLRQAGPFGSWFAIGLRVRNGKGAWVTGEPFTFDKRKYYPARPKQRRRDGYGLLCANRNESWSIAVNDFACPFIVEWDSLPERETPPAE